MNQSGIEYHGYVPCKHIFLSAIAYYFYYVFLFSHLKIDLFIGLVQNINFCVQKSQNGSVCQLQPMWGVRGHLSCNILQHSCPLVFHKRDNRRFCMSF
jgi:hypothetical protein